jgi:hypothetical protein
VGGVSTTLGDASMVAFPKRGTWGNISLGAPCFGIVGNVGGVSATLGDVPVWNIDYDCKFYNSYDV